VLKASAFVPGHVTGFFSIHDQSRKLRHRGSRGVGICLSKGVHTVVGITGSVRQSIDVFINDHMADAPLTKYAVQRLLGNDPLKVIIYVTLELPVSQGFGMSGAGALSSCLAVAEALEREFMEDEIICAAHEAEVKFKTGLGDVISQSMGGVVMRKMEGCPPFGVVEQMESTEKEIVLCVIGEGLPTKDIISDPVHKRKINDYGDSFLRDLQRNPSLEEVMRLSYKFSKETELLTQPLENAITSANEYGLASMSMLGNSIFAIGEKEKLAEVLGEFGEVIICKVDCQGMRIE
jgi:pantoate kinase